MKPYYDEDGVTIYHGDCRDLLPSLTVDAVVTDPPYGTNLYATDTKVFTAELLGQLVATAPTAVFGWPERLVTYCVDARLVPDEWVTWWPTNGACRGFNMGGLWRESEHVAIFGPHRFADLRKARGASSARIVAVDYQSEERRLDVGQPNTRRLGDVWTEPAPGLGFLSHRRLHPNEKPVGVVSRLVEALTTSGQVVLDPFAGSGTTLVAARLLGRRAIGIEIDEAHCATTVERLRQGVLDFGAAS